MKEFIISYPKEELEKILIELEKLNFIENENVRLELQDKYITKITYNGKEEFPEKILENNSVKYENNDETYIL